LVIKLKYSITLIDNGVESMNKMKNWFGNVGCWVVLGALWAGYASADVVVVKTTSGGGCCTQNTTSYCPSVYVLTGCEMAVPSAGDTITNFMSLSATPNSNNNPTACSVYANNASTPIQAVAICAKVCNY
jgi:hypothetical protein